MDESHPATPVEFSDVLARRALLAARPVAPTSPGVSSLNAVFAADGAEIGIRVRYVADRAALAPESLPRYLALFGGVRAVPFETLAQTILEDITDQIIPCWIEIRLRRDDVRSGVAVGHEVRVEDRQPRWRENGVLDRLEP